MPSRHTCRSTGPPRHTRPCRSTPASQGGLHKTLPADTDPDWPASVGAARKRNVVPWWWPGPFMTSRYRARPTHRQEWPSRVAPRPTKTGPKNPIDPRPGAIVGPHHHRTARRERGQREPRPRQHQHGRHHLDPQGRVRRWRQQARQKGAEEDQRLRVRQIRRQPQSVWSAAAGSCRSGPIWIWCPSAGRRRSRSTASTGSPRPRLVQRVLPVVPQPVLVQPGVDVVPGQDLALGRARGWCTSRRPPPVPARPAPRPIHARRRSARSSRRTGRRRARPPR
jgi:hypothetical protein